MRVGWQGERRSRSIDAVRKCLSVRSPSIAALADLDPCRPFEPPYLFTITEHHHPRRPSALRSSRQGIRAALHLPIHRSLVSLLPRWQERRIIKSQYVTAAQSLTTCVSNRQEPRILHRSLSRLFLGTLALSPAPPVSARIAGRYLVDATVEIFGPERRGGYGWAWESAIFCH